MSMTLFAALRCAGLLLLALAGAPAPAAPAPQDTLAQRLQACTVCHGAEGRATPQGYHPRLAGKPADYLYQQLLAFRDGRRPNAVMAGLMAPLSDAYLREIAAYFATLDLPYPPPARPAASPAQLRRGEQLVRQGDKARGLPACAACHGAGLGGRLPGIPGLLGLPPDYLLGQLGAWRVGQRRAQDPDCMAELARRLSPEDVAAVTRWIAHQPVPPGLQPEAPAPLPEPCGAAP
ncbi:c-type cytochrome [Inhella proteolytica]